MSRGSLLFKNKIGNSVEGIGKTRGAKRWGGREKAGGSGQAFCVERVKLMLC